MGMRGFRSRERVPPHYDARRLGGTAAIRQLSLIFQGCIDARAQAVLLNGILERQRRGKTLKEITNGLGISRPVVNELVTKWLGDRP